MRRAPHDGQKPRPSQEKATEWHQNLQNYDACVELPECSNKLLLGVFELSVEQSSAFTVWCDSRYSTISNISPAESGTLDHQRAATMAA